MYLNMYDKSDILVMKGLILMNEHLTDPGTGIELNPSHHGRECPGNGEHPGYECCCDECDYYLQCFPDWKDMNGR